MMPKTRLLGLFHLFRLELPFTAGVCVILGELLALSKVPTAREMILGFLSVFLISATSLILNDYFDLQSDKINAPERPLPAGLVTKRDVVLLSCGVTILGFITSFLLSFQALLVVILAWAVGFLYNWRFKKTGLLGNLMVSFSVGVTFIFGGIAVDRPFEMVVWFLGIFALLINAGEEIAADAWLSDDEHSNTMLSEFRSDIGAGVSMMRDEWGQDQIYVVIETALQTRSGQQQSGARDFLTRLPSIIAGTTSINGTPVPLSAGQYIIPVIQNTARPDGDVVHEVQYGQSLWSIAITYGTTIEQIQKLNNLGDSNIVYEQQLLLVQKGATQPAVIPTQTATAMISATPNPTITQTTAATGTAVVLLIISVSILIAGVGVSLRVKPAGEVDLNSTA